MPAEILNKAPLRAASDLLQLAGVKQLGARIDAEKLTPVYDLSAIIENPTYISQSWNALGLAGQSSGVAYMVGADGGLGPVPGGKTNLNVANAGRQARILSGGIVLTYNAAGSAADAGNRLQALGILTDPSGALSFPVVDDFAIVENGRTDYQWNFPHGARISTAAIAPTRMPQGAQWDGFIPPGFLFCWQISRQPGTGTFPALTSANGFGLVALRQPGLNTWR